MFADMDPDDRVWLLDELPASVAPRLLRGLPVRERQLTAEVLGYPQNAIGRRMSPEYVTTHPDLTVAQTMARVRARLDEAETIYTLPVTDHGREVVGVVSLRDLLSAPDAALVRDVMSEARTATATSDVEQAARLCADMNLLALPIVDSEGRLLGILTLDDAARILKQEESQDVARQGGVEPLGRPYLSTPITRLVRSRVVWLFVLAIGATLTVHVLEIFESTLAQLTALALFVPLLIGTGGNTGNQAATTVTRALALDEVRPRDILRVLGRELARRIPARTRPRADRLRHRGRGVLVRHRTRDRPHPRRGVLAGRDDRRRHAAGGPRHPRRPRRVLEPVHHHLRGCHRPGHLLPDREGRARAVAGSVLAHELAEISRAEEGLRPATPSFREVSAARAGTCARRPVDGHDPSTGTGARSGRTGRLPAQSGSMPNVKARPCRNGSTSSKFSNAMPLGMGCSLIQYV
ncbi:magnesium transporter [Microbacterium elymi]|uniref:magnesium transporter n=1 Tax=Microbacterium elymi TaxID=2909587 RepID=UPI003F496453